MDFEINLIYARSLNNVIGYKGKLPNWKIEGDLARFKQLTMGAILIMGKNTWYSLPFKLPGRCSIVITSKPNELEKIPYDPNLFNAETLMQIAALRPEIMPERMPQRHEEDYAAKSFDEALRFAKIEVRRQHNEDWRNTPNTIPEFCKIFVIGGAQVFKEAEPHVKYVYETLVMDASVRGDVFYEFTSGGLKILENKSITAFIEDDIDNNQLRETKAFFQKWEVRAKLTGAKPSV